MEFVGLLDQFDYCGSFIFLTKTQQVVRVRVFLHVWLAFHSEQSEAIF